MAKTTKTTETLEVSTPPESDPKTDISIERIKLLHPKLRAEALAIFNEINERLLTGRAKVRYTHTLRTNEEQNELFARGRTKPGRVVTNARGGDSYHNYGLAIDICLIINGKEASWDDKADYDKDGVADWAEIVAVFKRYGWQWGGDWGFQDKPHFQKTFGRSISQLKKAYKGEDQYIIF